jgi:L-threonylcarbamoyladenylate synthase
VESTVLDLTRQKPVVLRPGGLAIEKLREIAPNLIVQERFAQEGEEGIASPGMLLKHYSPEARLIFVSGDPETTREHIHMLANGFLNDGLTVGILAADEDARNFADIGINIEKLGPRHDLEKIASNLFSAIRSLDLLHVDVILVGEFSTEGLGLAIRDRLVRAAAGQIIRLE